MVLTRTCVKAKKIYLLALLYACYPLSLFAIPQPVIEHIVVTKKNKALLDIFLQQKAQNKRAKLTILLSTDNSRFAPVKKIKLRRFRRKKRFTVSVPLSREGSLTFRSQVVLPGGKSGPLSSSQEIYVEEDQIVEDDLWPALPAGFDECPAGFEKDAYAEVNRIRKGAGLRFLAEDYHLVVAARNHTIHMALHKKLSHEGWFDEVLALGLTATHYSQNVAYTFRSGKGVVQAWMASPSHAENILSAKSVHTGISCVKDSAGYYWWSQNFSN